MEGGPKQYTREEIAQLEKSRTISDGRLLQEGAEYFIDDKGENMMIPTEEQKEKIHESMEFSPKRMDVYSKYIDKKEIEEYLSMLDLNEKVNWHDGVSEKITKREKEGGVSEKMIADACSCHHCIAHYLLMSGNADLANHMKEKMGAKIYEGY